MSRVGALSPLDTVSTLGTVSRGARPGTARRLGAAVARRSPWRVVQGAFVTAAVTVVALACVAVVAVVAHYVGGEAVASDRGPRWPDIFPDETVSALWLADTGVLDSGQQAGLVALAALTEAPEPPPGVDVWPGPGEMVVSPAWLRYAAELPFGVLNAQIIGIIGVEGLVDDGEILAYVGGTIEQVAAGGGEEITGFGSERSPAFGTMLYRQPVWWLGLLAGLLLVAPAWFFLVTALRMGAGARARREQIMANLGASQRFTARVRFGEVARPVITGGGIALAVAAVLLTVDVPLLGTGVELRAAHLRALWWAVLAAVALGVVIAWVTALSGLGLRAERAREKEPRTPSAILDAVLAPFLAAAVVIAINLSNLHHLELVVLPLFWGGIIAVLLLTPRCIRGCLTLWTGRERREASASGDPGTIVALAQIAARPQPYGRFGAVAATAVILLAVVGRLAMLWGAELAEAQAEAGQITRTVGTVGIPWSAWRAGGDPDAVIAAATTVLDGEFYVVAVSHEHESVVGSLESLAAFGLTPGVTGSDDAATAHALGWRADLVSAEIGIPDADNTSLLHLRTRDGSPIDRDAANALLAEIVIPPLRVSFPGEATLAGAAVSQHQARWLDWFALGGMTILVASLWAGFTNELLRMRRNLLPAQVLAPDRTFTWTATFVRVVVPCAVFAAVGSVIALIVTLPLMNLGSALVTPPWASIIGASIVIVGSALIAWTLLARNIAAHSMSLDHVAGHE